MKHSVYSLLLSLEASLWLCWEICSSFRLSDYFYWFSKVTFLLNISYWHLFCTSWIYFDRSVYIGCIIIFHVCMLLLYVEGVLKRCYTLLLCVCIYIYI